MQTILLMKHYQGNFKTFQQHAALYSPEWLAEAQGLADCFGQEKKSVGEMCALDIILCVFSITSNCFSSRETLELDSERKRGYTAEQDTLQSKFLVSSLSTFFICLCTYIIHVSNFRHYFFLCMGKEKAKIWHHGKESWVLHFTFATILQPSGLLDGERAGLQPLLTPLGDHVPFENTDTGTK